MEAQLRAFQSADTDTTGQAIDELEAQLLDTRGRLQVAEEELKSLRSAQQAASPANPSVVEIDSLRKELAQVKETLE